MNYENGEEKRKWNVINVRDVRGREGDKSSNHVRMEGLRGARTRDLTCANDF